MADDNNNKPFFDALKKLFDETGRNENDANDHDIQRNSWIDFDIDVSTSSFSLETGVASSLATQFSIPSYGNSYGVSASDSVAGVQHSIYEAPEENPADSFLVPVETAKGDFRRTDDSQSNPSEHSSSQHSIGWSNRGRVPWQRLRHAKFGANESTCRKKESKGVKFFPQRKPNPPVSAWTPQISIERDRNEATAQTKEDYRELSSTSSIFSPIDDISSIEVDTHRTSLGSVAAAKAVSAAVPSGIQTQSLKTGKEKRFKCEICGKTYGHGQNLWRHKNKHKGHKPFECSACGKGFAERYHLRMHLLVHSGEKPHECTECHQRFRQKSHLTSHLRTHTEEKTFTCDLCHEGFPHKNTLKTHLRRHTGQEPHQCEVCRRDFAIKTNCIEHQRTEHGWK